VQFQYAPHRPQLETNYLTTDDGRCVLPVASTLAYAYWNQGQIGAWLDKLAARQANPRLGGDAQAAWLLAQAQAEEIGHTRPDRFRRVLHRYLAGQGQLQQATLTTQGEPARLQAFLQWAARFGAKQNVAGARHVLDLAAQKCTSSSATATINQWRAAVDQLAAALTTKHQQQELLAQAGYVTQLKRRHQAALDRGDAQAAGRYEQLIAAGGN